jgi:transposase
MTVITMSRNELTRLRVLIDVADGRLSVADATGLIGVGRRQIYRLLQAFRADGADGLISRKRGGPSNRALGSVFRETVLAIVRERYADFGPTLAAEKLSELHGLDLGVETLRQWMIGAGLWVRRKDRLKRVHQPRARRDCLGELVQIDGSEHWWFEDRGPQSTLLVYVDDATSRLMHLRFVETESTFDYFQATREYLEAHGKPIAFYSDKHGVFRVNSAGAVQGDGMTQFGRSLHALNIDILCANTPQARAASSAPTRPCRIAWSRSFAFRVSARSPPETSCCRVFWPITTPASARSRTTPRTSIDHYRLTTILSTSSPGARSARSPIT